MILGYVFNFEEIGFPEKLHGKCQRDQIFNRRLPYWNIIGITFPVEKGAILCIDSQICDMPDYVDGQSSHLTNTWNRVGIFVGTTFKFSCEMDGARGKSYRLNSHNFPFSTSSFSVYHLKGQLFSPPPTQKVTKMKSFPAQRSSSKFARRTPRRNWSR